MRKKLLFMFLLLGHFLMLGQNPAELDASFNIGAGFSPTNAIAKKILIRDNGKIILGGSFTSFNSVSTNYIVGLNSDGTVDNTFNIGTGFNGQVEDMEFTTDGKILVVGSFNSYKGVFLSWTGMVRLNNDGSIDNSFVPGTSSLGNSYCLKSQNDGKIIIGGLNLLKRIFQNGGLDTSFVLPSNLSINKINSIDIQSDGKIILGGDFGTSSPTIRNLIRLNSDGSIDNTFLVGAGTNNGGQLNSVKIQSDGKILCGGSVTTYDGQGVSNLFRVNQNGTFDNTFNANSNGFINDILIQSDNKILIVGNNTSYNSISANHIIRLNVDGSKDNSFDYGTGFNSNTFTLAVQSDGKVYVSGTINSYNGSVIKQVIRLKGDSVLSINNFHKSKIVLLINPVKDYLIFTIDEVIDFKEYEIINLLGEKVSYGILNSNSIYVDNLESGLYIIRIRTNNGVLSSKFIKE